MQLNIYSNHTGSSVTNTYKGSMTYIKTVKGEYGENDSK